jgi:YVTN family beta-propeller protein
MSSYGLPTTRLSTTAPFWLVCVVSLVAASAVLLSVAGVHAATDCNPCVYVANQRSTSVTVIDGSNNTVLLNIPAGQTPQFVAVNPSGTRVYVSTHGLGNTGLVTVIDTGTYQIVANIPVGPNPTGLAVNPAGTRLFVLNSGDDTMSVVDTNSNNVVSGPVPVAASPYDIVVSPNGQRLFVSATNLGSVQVLDALTSQQIGGLVKTGTAASGLALNAAGTRLYVADFVKGNVDVVDTAGPMVTGVAPAGAGAIALALDPNTGELYAANFGGGNGTTVSVINTANNANTATINVGTSPHALALNAAGTLLYVANQQTHTVSVVNAQTKQIAATVPVDASPSGLGLVYAMATTVPALSPHIVSAVNGQPRFNPGATASVALNDIVQFTVRVPSALLGMAADVRYFLSANLTFVGASAGTQLSGVCAPAAIPMPNGVQGDAQLLKCSLNDASKPLIITAKITGTAPPRDDPYAAVACFSLAFTNCVPVRVAIQFAPPPLSPVGPQRTAVILVNAPNAGPHPYADKQATASVFYSSANSKSARTFLWQASYGLMTVVGSMPGMDGTASDVYGPFAAPTNACTFDVVSLADPQVDYTKYDRLVILTNNPNCGGGSAYPGTFQTGEGQRTLSLAWLHNTAFGETTLLGKIGNAALHEYGHNLGLSHAGAWYCAGVVTATNGCYGNSVWAPIDMSSQSSKYAHPNSVHKQMLGWLEGGRIFPIWTAGAYTINPYEDGTENVKVLKIPRKRDANGKPIGYYYVSYDQPMAPWATDWLSVAPSFAQGVAIQMDEGNGPFDTALLDATPGSIAGFQDITDGALLPGQTFTDALAGVSITLNSANATAAQVTVTIQAPATRFIQLAIKPNTLLVASGPTAGTVTGGGIYDRPAGDDLGDAAAGLEVREVVGLCRQPRRAQANPFTITVGGDRVLWALFGARRRPTTTSPRRRVMALPLQESVFARRHGGGRRDFPGDVCRKWGALRPDHLVRLPAAAEPATHDRHAAEQHGARHCRLHRERSQRAGAGPGRVQHLVGSEHPCRPVSRGRGDDVPDPDRCRRRHHGRANQVAVSGREGFPHARPRPRLLALRRRRVRLLGVLVREPQRQNPTPSENPNLFGRCACTGGLPVVLRLLGPRSNREAGASPQGGCPQGLPCGDSLQSDQSSYCPQRERGAGCGAGVGTDTSTSGRASP